MNQIWTFFVILRYTQRIRGILSLAFDIKIENIFRFVSNLFNKSVEKIKSEYDDGKLDTKQEANLEKIKSLREDKKKLYGSIY